MSENELITSRDKAIFIIGFIFSMISILAVIFVPFALAYSLLLTNFVLFIVVTSILGAIALTGLVLNSIAFAKSKKNLSLIGLLLALITIIFVGLYMMFYFI